MSTSRIFKFAVLHAALTLTAGHALAGGGEGFNGPVTSTTSIPIQVDRGISKADVQVAVQKCRYDGDSKQGLTSFGQRVAQVFLGMGVVNWQTKFPGTTLTQAIITPLFTQNDKQGPGVLMVTGSDSYESEKGYMMETTIDNAPTQWLGDTYTKIDLLPTGTPYEKQTHLINNSVMPILHFSSVIGQSDYDELGNLVRDKQLYNGLSIYVDQSLVDAGYMLRYFNMNTNVELGVKIDVRGYIECLKSELEQRAK